MIWGRIRNARAKPAPRPTAAAARVLVRVAVPAVAGLAITVAAAAVPAGAAQQPPGAAVGHTRPATTGGHPLTSDNGPHWTHIAAGGAHTCGIRAGGTLWCWGYNGSGQLGLGSHTEQDLPRQVTTPAPGGWASITAGVYHTCATRTDGTLWCWGWNRSGQLGLGGDTGQDLPRQVITPARGGWASVTAGYAHTCATRTDGTLWCWGDNSSGDLGLGNQDEQDLPRQVTSPAPGGWASTTAGNAHTCATRTDGTVWCWGNNQFGQLGTGGIDNGQFLPKPVTTPAPGGWAGVTVGEIYTCATRTDGTLWCWGWNHFGQLGTGNHTDQDLPRQVTAPAPGGWGSTTAGSGHTCATRTDGTLWCWGWDHYGQLGIRRHADRDLPQQVTAPAAGGWASTTAGNAHTCATRTDGTLWCWGWNHFGQLGIGNDADQCLPRQVPGPQQTGTPTPPARTSPHATRRARGLHQATSGPPFPRGTTGKTRAGPLLTVIPQ